MRTRIDDGARQLARDHHVAVLAAKSDRFAAGLVDVADDPFVDRSGQHHLDDFQRLFVGNAQPGRVLRLDADLLEHRLDLRAAAVHDDRINRRLLQEHDVAGELARQMLLAHGVTAILHDDDLLVVALHVGQGLGEDARLHLRAYVVALAHGRYLPGSRQSDRRSLCSGVTRERQCVSGSVRPAERATAARSC